MKLAIIGGAGLLGSTTAFYAGSLGCLSEIKLVDLNQNMLMSHVMDMDQALSSITNTKVTYATYEEINDCDIILLTASLPETNVSSRNEYLKGNLGIVESVCKEISKLEANKIIINATNPIDVFNYVIYKMLGYDRNKIIGFSINDTIRLEWAIAKLLNIKSTEIKAICLGEHGDGQVPLFDRVEHNNKKIFLSEEQRQSVSNEISSWFTRYQALKSGRTSGWTSAVGLTRIIQAIATDAKDIVPCSVILDGEYGENDVSIGVPIRLGKNGVEQIIQLDLTDEQNSLFNKSSIKIKDLIKSINY